MNITSLRSSQLNLLLIISAGGMLEAYDFIVYGIMVAYISPSFFPAAEAQQGLFIAFATFSIGYLSRPLGGLIFGHLGDRYGRKKAFTTTLLLMAVATVAIGFLPGFCSIGMWAPFILVTLRFIQGVSIGGEVGGVYTYIGEVFKQHKGLAVAIIASSMKLGMLLGQGVHAVLFEVLGTQGMIDFGWRIPFWLGGVLGIAGFIIRKNSLESEAFRRMQSRSYIARVPLFELRRYLRHCLCGTLLVSMLSISFMIFLIYIPNTLITMSHPAGTPALSCYMLVVTVITNLLLGFLLDKNSKSILVIAATGLIIGGPGLVWLIFNTSGSLVSVAFFCGLLISLSCVPPLFILSSLFSVSVRYTGIAVTYGVGFAIGGLTPAIATWLSSELSIVWTASCLLMGAGVSGLIALMLQNKPVG